LTPRRLPSKDAIDVPPLTDVPGPGRLEMGCAAVLATGLFAASACAWVSEMATSIPDAAQSGNPAWGADARLIVWILGWVVHALGTGPTRLFDANIYHPIPSMLTGSEHLLSAVVFTGPVYALSDNPILAANIAAMSTYVLAAVVTYALMRTLALPVVAAGVAGAAFALGPLQVPADVHVLQYPSWCLALVLLVSVRATRTGRYRWVMPAVTFAVFSSYYIAAMTAVVLASESVIVLRTLGRKPALRLLAAATPAYLLLALFSLPYLGGTTSRPAAESVDGWIVASQWFWSKIVDPGSVDPGFGWGLVVLASAGLLVPLAQRRRPSVRWWRWLALSILGASLAAPLFVTIGAVDVPMPSALLSFLPLRANTRWILLAQLGLVGLAAESTAAGIGWLTRHATVPVPLGVLLGGALILIVWTPRARHLLDQPLTALPTGDAVPAVDRWLATNASGPLLEPPAPTVANWLLQADAMVLSLYHRLPLLNGHTGFPPWAYAAIAPEIARLPEREALQTLVDLTGLEWVLVRRERVPSNYLARWEAFDRRDEAVERVQYGGPDLLYRVTLAPHHDWAQALALGQAQPDRTALGTPLATLDESDVRGRLTGRVPPRVRAGTTESVAVVVTNTGTQDWPALIAPGAPDAGAVRLVARWYASDASTAGETLHAITRDVVPGEPVRLRVEVPVPTDPGTYALELGVTQLKGATMRAVVSEPLTVDVGVR